MIGLALFLSLAQFTAAGNAKPPAAANKPVAATAAKAGSATKATKANPKASKPAVKPTPKVQPTVADLDKLCRRDLAWGKLQAVRERCADLQPRTAAAAAFWHLTLSDDPTELRKGFAPAALAKNEFDSRLLLAAGRYHFARGQIREMEDLVELARKQKLGGPEVDTLKHLAAGK